MSLTDVMSGAGLVVFNEVGLIVSLVAFLGIVVWTVLRPSEEMDAEARKPLAPDGPPHGGVDSRGMQP